MEHSSYKSWEEKEATTTTTTASIVVPLIPHRRQKERKRLLDDDRSAAAAADPEATEEQQAVTQQQQQMGGLYEEGRGIHYVDLWCGSPPQRQTLMVDTGSSVTAFPCSGCGGCGDSSSSSSSSVNIDTFFQEERSSTFYKFGCNECVRGRCTVAEGAKHNDCKIGMRNQEGGSWTAFEAKDKCYFGGPHNRPLTMPNNPLELESLPESENENESKNESERDGINPEQAASYAFDLVFGCQTKVTGSYQNKIADGIMGMDNARDAFWHQMYTAEKIAATAFALCFGTSPPRVDDRRRILEGAGGALTLGGVDTRLHKTTMVYTQNNKAASASYYGVGMRKIYLRQGGGGAESAHSNDAQLNMNPLDVSEKDLNSGGTVIDSGTTAIYLTRKVQLPFEDAWKKVTGKKYSRDPLELSESQLAMYPVILIQMEGHEDRNAQIAGDDPGTIPELAHDIDSEHPYDVVLAISPQHYMEYDEDIRKYVPNINFDEDRGGNVLGASAMMGHDILFDIEQNTVGWAESECDYTELLSQNGYSVTATTTNNNKGDQYNPPELDTHIASFLQDIDDNRDDSSYTFQRPVPTQDTFCVDHACQYLVVGLFIFAGLILALVWRTRSRIPYQYGEIELQYASNNQDEDEEYDNSEYSDGSENSEAST